ncbi:flavodoxin domain-containing protein [Lacrimispora defluvii]|uniref:Flavodoxin domain-containing protein n=1 Tax=Lacrimispora defluvii TaxID=2719233 RepID=A0ABX1VLA9_9FIRM|nr:flavodoxin domain-containing protein [Lacrimispora defluvii]NNJ28635.1 hypothetical protein [Lacrimispora defluvii]
MKTIVVYQSSTGFTKQYAQWIAEDLKCQAVSLKEVSEQAIRENECIIFGGWIMGGMINGLDKVLKMNPKQLVVFAVGASPEKLTDTAEMKKQNHIEDKELFYLVGGFRFSELNFMIRAMLKTMKKSAAKKEDKTPQDQFMADTLGTSFDNSDRTYITPLVTCVKEK